MSKPFTIAISTDKPVIKSGADATIKVQLSNTSSHALDLSGSVDGFTSLDPCFVFEVTDHNGRAVPKRVYEHPELAPGHPENRTVEPGATFNEEQIISRGFEFSRPGEYLIQVSRSPAEGVQIFSNKLTLTVVSRL